MKDSEDEVKSNVKTSEEAFTRIRLLNCELNSVAADAANRSESVMNKASFLAVSSGIIIAASTAQTLHQLPWAGVTAIALACLALCFSAFALRPGKRKVLDGRRLVDLYVDSKRTPADIERTIVKNKAIVLEQREQDLTERASWVSLGFGVLAFAALALTTAFAAEALGG